MTGACSGCCSTFFTKEGWTKRRAPRCLAVLLLVLVFIILVQFVGVPVSHHKLKEQVQEFKEEGGLSGTNYNTTLIKTLTCSEFDADLSFPSEFNITEIYDTLGCIVGRNVVWPTDTSGIRHFLDTNARILVTTLLLAMLVLNMLPRLTLQAWPNAMLQSLVVTEPLFSFKAFFHIISFAQFIVLLGQLQNIAGPSFFYEFTKYQSWSNFNLIRKAHVEDVDATVGLYRYSRLIGVKHDKLLFYTMIVTGLALIIFCGAYYLWASIVKNCIKSETQARGSSRKRVIIHMIFSILLLAEYAWFSCGIYFMKVGKEESKPVRIFIGAIIVVVYIIVVLIYLIRTSRMQAQAQAQLQSGSEKVNRWSRYFVYIDFGVQALTGIFIGAIEKPRVQMALLIAIWYIYLILLLFLNPRTPWSAESLVLIYKICFLSLMLLILQIGRLSQKGQNQLAYSIIGLITLTVIIAFLWQIFVMIRVLCWRKQTSQEDQAPLETPTGTQTEYQDLESGTAEVKALSEKKDQDEILKNKENASTLTRGTGYTEQSDGSSHSVVGKPSAKVNSNESSNLEYNYNTSGETSASYYFGQENDAIRTSDMRFQAPHHTHETGTSNEEEKEDDHSFEGIRYSEIVTEITPEEVRDYSMGRESSMDTSASFSEVKAPPAGHSSFRMSAMGSGSKMQQTQSMQPFFRSNIRTTGRLRRMDLQESGNSTDAASETAEKNGKKIIYSEYISQDEKDTSSLIQKQVETVPVAGKVVYSYTSSKPTREVHYEQTPIVEKVVTTSGSAPSSSTAMRTEEATSDYSSQTRSSFIPVTNHSESWTIVHDDRTRQSEV